MGQRSAALDVAGACGTPTGEGGHGGKRRGDRLFKTRTQRHRMSALGKFAGRRTQPFAGASAAIVIHFFGGDPYEATNRARGVPT
eukprot:1324717-Pyramimonas_sp.AAC.1